MNQLKRKQEKGITLIALIVTIIVLIILAVISMNAILGEDGIIKRAERSKAEHNEAVAKEEVERAYSGIVVGLYDNTVKKEEIATKLGEKLGITVTEDDEGYTMNYKGYDITIPKEKEEKTIITFTMKPNGGSCVSTEPATYEAYNEETWAEWIERNNGVLNDSNVVGGEFLAIRSFIGYSANGDLSNYDNYSRMSYSLKEEETGETINKEDKIENGKTYVLSIEG